MPDLTIIDRKVYFDRQHVADLAPSLVEGTSLHADFLGALHTGADFDHVVEELKQPLDADLERLEDEVGAAEERASEAQAAAEDAKADLKTLTSLVASFLAGPGGASADLVRAHFAEWPEVLVAFEGAKKDAD